MFLSKRSKLCPVLYVIKFSKPSNAFGCVEQVIQQGEMTQSAAWQRSRTGKRL
ncbi:hypothetical protein NWP17_11570 [Chrysosporum bergii ANA360D]|uniref:Uncharacterized protein n=1 Tax=Chrysosporum bergii ANA360D TaxID=617107 RepID=A0AA43GSU8_9CYAN|nr:hypothetical protein [Chrysosporum bergii]MDH6061072.1 hypothetical protein [Chrysosporum bergii ANA360D]